MNALAFGMAAGIAFGVIDVLLMIPLDHPDKRTAMIGGLLAAWSVFSSAFQTP